ncbi:MAG: glycosyltransferase [Planctomycetota bacterium]
MRDALRPLRLGVLVPCRDEERVLPRKLANLAQAEWPASDPDRPHRVAVVDDGSRDATLDAARAAAERFGAGVEACAVRNDGTPGKAGAIGAGLAALGDVDLVVLTDADVVVRPDALTALAAAFSAEPELAMACGAQEFVRDLAEDGTCRAEGGGEPVPAGGLYDRWTAGVRALESRLGRVFSVHGQLLAWRAELGLRPTPGVAADDIELMLQARRAGGRVRLVPRARFLEVKTPAGAARDGQAMRRARAYFQVLRRSGAPRAGLLDRAQWWCYRTLPGLAPWLLLAVALALPLALGLLGGTPWLVAGAAAVAAVLLAPVGRRLVWLLDVIVRAWWRERREPLSDRWEMERT